MSGSSQPVVVASARGTAQPHLRLVGGLSAAGKQSAGNPRPVGRQGDGYVLVAGADAPTRARMLAELRSVLPAGTQFVEACETWEVVARAPESRMVVLAGDLADTSSASLLRLLARRNPTLPVLAVGAGEHRQALDVAHA
jgi:hypothetical protein